METPKMDLESFYLKLQPNLLGVRLKKNNRFGFPVKFHKYFPLKYWFGVVYNMAFQIYALNRNVGENFKWNWQHVKREKDNRLDVPINFIEKLGISLSSRSYIDFSGNTDYAVEEMEFCVLFNQKDVSWTEMNDVATAVAVYNTLRRIEVARFTAV